MQHSPPTQRKSPPTHESPSLKDVPRMWTPGGTPGATKKEYKPIKIETVKQPSERKTSVCIPEPVLSKLLSLPIRFCFPIACGHEVMATFESLQLMPFCLEKSSVRKFSVQVVKYARIMITHVFTLH